MATQSRDVVIHWFRKGLRLHDCPSLLEACRTCSVLYPVFIIDPHFVSPRTVGVNRFNFLLESLTDLDSNLRAIGSRLIVARGSPERVLPELCQKWGVSCVVFEQDTEPYARARDSALTTTLSSLNIRVKSLCGHTLHHPEEYLAAVGDGRLPSTYGAFCKLFTRLGRPSASLPTVTAASLAHCTIAPVLAADEGDGESYSIPTLQELGYVETPTAPFPGKM